MLYWRTSSKKAMRVSMTPDNEHTKHDVQGFHQLFQIWRQIIDDTYKRRFLEAYPRLVGPELNALSGIDIFREDEGFKLLWEIRQRGGSGQAIREIFVDHYGGLVLDLPQWMEKVKGRYDDLYYDQLPSQTA